MKEKAEQHIFKLIERYPVLRTQQDTIRAAVQLLVESYHMGGRCLVCGNGGSAADSLHIVGELMKGFAKSRPLSAELQKSLRSIAPETADYLIRNLQEALPAISLVSEISLCTAFANDQSSDLSFAQQVLGQGKAGDVLLAISTSGNSANVLYAAQLAKAKGLGVIGLTGMHGGKLRAWSDAAITVPEWETYKIQELHLPVYHAICLALEEEYFGS